MAQLASATRSGAADARLLPHRVVSSMFAAPPYFIGNHYVTLIDVQAVAWLPRLRASHTNVAPT